MPHERAPGQDLHIFVGDDVAERHAVAHARALEENGIAQLRALFHRHAGEEDAVLHAALDGAAVGDERIFHAAARREIARRLVVLLGEDGPRGGK